jgi:hypothetical protein
VGEATPAQSFIPEQTNQQRSFRTFGSFREKVDAHTVLTILNQVFFLLKTITVLIKVHTQDKM